MNVVFRLLKTKYFPELNEEPVGVDRIIEVLDRIGTNFFRLPMEGKGAYVVDTEDKSEYVFISDAIRNLLDHETVAYEGVHAFAHIPSAKFLERKNNLEAEVISLIMMMPVTDLPRLNKIKHQLDEESYEYLERRNKAYDLWEL